MTRGPCQHLEIEPEASGKIVMRRRPYRCLWPVPEIVFPNSISGSVGFHWPLSRTKVWKETCATCPCHVERAKA